MTTEKKKRLMLQSLAAVIPAVVILALFLFPHLLRADSNPVPLEFTIETQKSNGNMLVLQGSVSKDISAGETVWLYAENAEVTVSVCGNQFRFHGQSDAPDMFRSPGSDWYSFPSPGIKSGEPVEFTIRSYYNENTRAAASLLGRMYIGDGAGLLSLLLKQIHFFSLVLICAVIAGMLYLVEGAINVALGMAEGVQIALFGLYFLTGGLWCVPDVFYPYLSLLISPPWVVALLDMSGLLLFPIVLALMMRYYIRRTRNRWIMNGILWAEIATAVVCLLFQLTGKADLMEQQLVIGSVALICLGTAMVCVVLELRRYKDRYLLFLFLSVLPVFICEILDGINLLWPFMPRRVLMQYSFGLSILLLVFQFVSYANTELAKAEKLRKAEQELVDSRISVMLSQIQPHFLYNTLAGIKELCDTGEQQTTSKALEHFTYYLRGNMDSLSDERLIPFAQEVSHVRDYLYLEQMRFEDKLGIVWDLQFTDFLLPPLTLQPIVENAVQHGITEKKGGGILTIRSDKIEDTITITVTDDGVGFDPSQTKEDGRTHIGISNVRNRLCTQCGGALTIESKLGAGTIAKITLPGMEVQHEDYSGG